jgi:bifunctional NMN adenylyltransferase/nudix hydrolase
MNTKDYDVTVFIGRFQPFHSMHLRVVMEALTHAEFLILIVGSANQPRRPDSNPFFFEERKAMILASLPVEVRDRVIIVPMHDSNYDKNAWVADVAGMVWAASKTISDKPLKVALIGHSKDHTSYYLKMFQQWGSIDVTSSRQLDATLIRDHYLTNNKSIVEAMFKKAIENEDIPVGAINWLRDFQKLDVYGELVDEREFYRNCQAGWAKESWPNSRNTVTGGALLHQAGYVLLVQRGEYPQKNTWAITGGHLNIDETVYDCALREGYEETGIKVPKIVFERSLVAKEYFDAPRRDPRGRYIDHTFLFDLRPQAPAFDSRLTKAANQRRVKDALDLPSVKGLDDAKDARWWHVSELDRSVMFLDHFAIIQTMLARLPNQGVS